MDGWLLFPLETRRTWPNRASLLGNQLRRHPNGNRAVEKSDRSSVYHGCWVNPRRRRAWENRFSLAMMGWKCKNPSFSTVLGTQLSAS